MKRLMLVMAMGLAATTTETGDWRLGIFGGANIADLKIEGVPKNEKKTRTGGAFGGVLAWRPTDVWSIELRPGYTSGGAKVLVEGIQADISANYLELPLLVTRDLGSGRGRPYLLAGAALSHLSSAKAKLPTGTLDIKQDFEGSDVSFRLGAGLRAAAAAGQPFLEFEYAWGSRNLNNDRSGLGADVGAIKNRGLQIRAGFTFASGQK